MNMLDAETRTAKGTDGDLSLRAVKPKPLAARGDTRLLGFTIFYGVDAHGEIFYYFKRQDGRWPVIRLYEDYNACLRAVRHYDNSGALELDIDEDAAWWAIEEQSMLQGCLPCRACNDIGYDCAACR